MRQEAIPSGLLKVYRQKFSTLYDRADLYVPFIEKSLGHVAPQGALGFICANRWMKNRYGGPLRKLVSEGYHLKYYVDMVDTPAFQQEVIAYPAITVLTREKPGVTRVAYRPEVDKKALTKLAAEFRRRKDAPDEIVKEVTGIVRGDAPWVLESLDGLRLIRRLEKKFPKLEEAGCKVGIGVATGADKVFIGSFEDLNVEVDCKLPLVMTRDVQSGQIKWRGLGVINPFGEDGKLVDLKAYPRLRAYLEMHEEVIRRRNVAKRNPVGWYRTIDRIYPELVETPKLLIPDIKGEPHVVYDPGGFYPHHNLYYVTSETWDLKALQAVLRSGIAQLFVSMYSTRMRGGYLRYQAQYLRRIRVPFWEDVSKPMRKALGQAAKTGDLASCNEAVCKLYGVKADERALVMEETD